MLKKFSPPHPPSPLHPPSPGLCVCRNPHPTPTPTPYKKMRKNDLLFLIFILFLKLRRNPLLQEFRESDEPDTSSWEGTKDPTKRLLKSTGEGRVRPEHSFEAFLQTVEEMKVISAIAGDGLCYLYELERTWHRTNFRFASFNEAVGDFKLMWRIGFLVSAFSCPDDWAEVRNDFLSFFKKRFFYGKAKVD